MEDYMVLANYVKSFDDGKVTGYDNVNGSGRITILSTPAAKEVGLSAQNVTLNGTDVEIQGYNIDGYNYFKLRDIASLLIDTPDEFNVDFDSDNNTVLAVKGGSYTKVDGDLAIGEDNSSSCVASSQYVKVNDKYVSVQAYNIGGYNYLQLRDLGSALDFGVDDDADTNTAVITAK